MILRVDDCPPARRGGAPVRGRVSVIIPVHNRVQYLACAIESALGQAYPDVEGIVVDDGSPVDPAPVLAAFGDRVRFTRKVNGGLASARNWGIRRSSGEYVLWLDDDDFLERTALDDLRVALAECPG